MADEDLLIRAAIRDELTGPLEKIRDELRRTSSEAKKSGASANIGARGFDKMASGAARFVKAGVGIAAKAAAAGIAAATTAAVVGSVKLLNLASDAAETASAFGTVFKGVSGDVAGYVRKMRDEFGLTTRELQTAATTFGVFGKAAGVSRKDLGGFTKDLVGAGLDLSSFYNADPTEVFQALRSGLAGEAEPLRQFGIFLSDATMKSEAATMGLTGTLTESQKVMVRQRIIMKSLGDANGDLARTSNGFANQTRALKGRLTEAATAIGTALLPAGSKLVTWANGKASTAVTYLNDNLEDLQAKVGHVSTALSYAAGLAAKGEWLEAVGTIDDVTGANGRLLSAAQEAKGILEDVGTILREVLLPAMGDASDATGGLSSPLGLLRDALGFVADHTTAARRVLVGLVVALTAAKVATVVYTGVTKAKAAADAVSLFWLKAHTVGTKTQVIWSGAVAAATGVWTAAQWLLNAALTANPIGIVIVVLAALVAAIIIAYKKSETFRKVVKTVTDGIAAAWRWLWNNVLQPIFKLLTEGIAFIIRGFADLLDAMSHVPGFGWAKDAADKMRGAADAVDGFAQSIRDIPDRTVHIDVAPPSASQLARVDAMLNRTGGALGDTATSKARGGNLTNTLATHASTVAATGARPTITNLLIGGGGKGRGSGDHQAGRALDLTGKGLAKYGAHMRAIGGYAAFHGSGSSRHLHAVPPAMGDTVHSRARVLSRPTRSTGGGVTIAPGAIRVEVLNPSSDVDVAEAVRQGIEEFLRDQDERS